MFPWLNQQNQGNKKQELVDFYRNNVSQFNKTNNPSNPSNPIITRDDKKKRLQIKDNEQDTFINTFSDNKLNQQPQQSYADILKQQIQQKALIDQKLKEQRNSPFQKKSDDYYKQDYIPQQIENKYMNNFKQEEYEKPLIQPPRVEIQQEKNKRMAQELSEQIKEKQRLVKEQKEKENLLDLKYEQRVKADLQDLNKKYENEMKEKQLEIKTIKYHAERKRMENQEKEKEEQNTYQHAQQKKQSISNQIVNNKEMIIISPVKNKKEEENYNNNSNDNIVQNQNKENNYSNSNQNNFKNQQFQNNQSHLNNSVLPNYQMNNNLQAEIQTNKLLNTFYQFLHQKDDKLNNELNQNYSSQKQFWMLKDKKNDEELFKIKDQLEMQTSLLQKDVQNMRQQAQIAQEVKNQALINLQNLKETLQKQNIYENTKQKEINYNLNTNLQKQSAQNLLASNSIFSHPLMQQKQANNPSLLNYKLEKRLNNVQFNQAEMQLLEVDNLLKNFM